VFAALAAKAASIEYPLEPEAILKHLPGRMSSLEVAL
jgi:hypothetical protein